ncbi:MAG: hypothetical protein D6728_00150 [Cyanobacteria bacterium J055]|nr:MAG: hypothetical protein D6728_00150 [Cyanobacteria bacterium J055]
MEVIEMSQWQPVGNGLEAKVTNSGKVLVREEGEYNDEYPHYTLEFDSDGNIIDYHYSESRRGSRYGKNEIVAIAIAFLRGVGML